MSTFWSILEIIGSVVFVFFFIGLCIFSHELGHFLAARWRRLHIDAFSIGFKKVWAKKINGVEYRIGCIPLGGYVELPQVDATDDIPKSADGTELKRAKPVDRIITAVAGPLFNILFGLLLGCVVWLVGVPQESPVMNELKVATVEENSPEYRAGLRPGDVIVAVNGERFRCTWIKFVEKLFFSIGEVSLDVRRDGRPLEIRYTPIENPNAPGRLKYEKIGYPFFTAIIPIELHPQPGSPAERAGLRPGDRLVAIDGQPVNDFLHFQLLLNNYFDRPLEFRVERAGETLTLPVTPEAVPGLDAGHTSYRIGILFDLDRKTPTIKDIFAASPAAAVDLAPGDRILAADGVPTATNEAIIRAVERSAGKPVVLRVQRGDAIRQVTLAARKVVPMTIGVELVSYSHPTPFEQFRHTLSASYKSLRGMLISGGKALGLTDASSTLKARHMSGPLGMGTMLFSLVKDVSLMTGLSFVVMISFALAIFNLLPLPVLDGGHITFALIELIIRRPLPNSIIKALSMAFVGLLIGLMLYITYFDALRTYRTFAGDDSAPAVEKGAEAPKEASDADAPAQP